MMNVVFIDDPDAMQLLRAIVRELGLSNALWHSRAKRGLLKCEKRGSHYFTTLNEVRRFERAQSAAAKAKEAAVPAIEKPRGVPDDWLSLHEAEARVSVPREKLRTACEQERIVARHVGRRWWLSPKSLTAFAYQLKSESPRRPSRAKVTRPEEEEEDEE
jgi:hypothetical protein